MFEDADENDIRLSKQFRFDFFKHLSNLNLACILLVAGLLERVFGKPPEMEEEAYRGLVQGIFGGYTFSLIACLILLFIMPWLVTSKREGCIAAIGSIVTLVAVVFFLHALHHTVGLAAIQ